MDLIVLDRVAGNTESQVRIVEVIKEAHGQLSSDVATLRTNSLVCAQEGCIQSAR